MADRNIQKNHQRKEAELEDPSCSEGGLGFDGDKERDGGEPLCVSPETADDTWLMDEYKQYVAEEQDQVEESDAMPLAHLDDDDDSEVQQADDQEFLQRTQVWAKEHSCRKRPREEDFRHHCDDSHDELPQHSIKRFKSASPPIGNSHRLASISSQVGDSRRKSKRHNRKDKKGGHSYMNSTDSLQTLSRRTSSSKSSLEHSHTKHAYHQSALLHKPSVHERLGPPVRPEHDKNPPAVKDSFLSDVHRSDSDLTPASGLLEENTNRRIKRKDPDNTSSYHSSKRTRRNSGRAEVAELSGVVVSDNGSYGFIKPHNSLPDGYANKDIYFKQNSQNLQKGDTVWFVIGKCARSKPSARQVWRKEEIIPKSKYLESVKQNTMLGTIVEIAEGKGHMEIVGVVPEKYKAVSKRLYFDQSWVSCGNIDLVPGDILQFNIEESRRRNGELQAYQIKLSECQQRGEESIHTYIEKILNQVETDGFLADILSCVAIWNMIGKSKDMSTVAVIQILELIIFLQKKSQGQPELFRHAIKTLVYSGFCNIQDGALKNLIQAEWGTLPTENRDKVKNFLLMILKHVPERARLVRKLIAVTLPKGKNSFKFDALKLVIREKEGDIFDYEWNELPLVPTMTELLSPDGLLEQLKEVRAEGPYDNVDEYMDTYFRLLRADCFSALQYGIDSYLEKTLDPRDMSVYTDVALTGIHISTKGSGIILALKVKPLQDLKNWEASSKLMSGNLLCLSPSGSFKDAIWATVAKREEQIVWIELVDEMNASGKTKSLMSINNASGKMVMAESPTYYKAHQPVLKALQHINPSELPFQEELIHLDCAHPSPYAEYKAKQPTSTSPPQNVPQDGSLEDKLSQKAHQESVNCSSGDNSPSYKPQSPAPTSPLYDTTSPPYCSTSPSYSLNSSHSSTKANMRGRLIHINAHHPMKKQVQIERNCSASMDDVGNLAAQEENSQFSTHQVQDSAEKSDMDDGSSVPDSSVLSDWSQQVALEQALNNRVTIIQGPPGTGKTYVGIQIVRELLSCKETKQPIAVMTYKNHALDEFLKGIIHHSREGDIVRIGGRCQDPEVARCNLHDLMVSKRSKRPNATTKLWFRLKDEASDLKEKIKNATQELLQAKMFSVNTLLNIFCEEQIEALLHKCRATIRDDKGSKQIVNGRLMVPLWRESKEILLNEDIPFDKRIKIIPKDLLAFIEATLEHWTAPAKLFSETMYGGGSLLGFISGPSPKKRTKKASKRQEFWPDERDLEEEQKERMTAGGNMQNKLKLDIRVEDEQYRNNHLLEMTPSAERLAEEISLAKVKHIPQLWDLTPYDRAVVIQVALWHYNAEAEKHLDVLMKEYSTLLAAMQEVDNERKLKVLRNAKVVGMTITGASINQCLMKMLQPSVVLVEEAAEVLEPQITAILGNCNVKHLILIGDHKQLRPQVENYNLCRNFHFDISMMERLINNGYPHATLKQQNRMRPEIAELLSDIYPDLKSNLTRVNKNKAPDFTPSSMFFWTHKDPEEAARSYSNKKEAERVLQLAMVFLQMGYEPKQITILAGYRGQVRLLRNLLKEAEMKKPHVFSRFGTAEEKVSRTRPQASDNPNSPRRQQTACTISVSTIDLFQGDENDIIIVSLVRSNKNGQIGFMKTQNRRCVAQSRAKCGMFIVGNETTFLEAKKSSWVPFIKCLQGKQLIGPQFPMHCPDHKGITEIRARTAEELPLEVICGETCTKQFKCGIHPCPHFCHPKHSHNKCMEYVKFVLPCKHAGQRRCYQTEAEINCKEWCTELMLCGKHPCKQHCASNHRHNKELCRVHVDFVFTLCQHSIQIQCGQEGSKLRCKEKVKFQIAECKHQATRECWQKETDISCVERCTWSLPCGHPCEERCGDPCEVSKCKTCGEKRKHEMKQQIKAEERARDDARTAAKTELREFIANNKVLHHCRTDLQRNDNDASEYFDVEDRVKRYIQPGHGWFPQVIKIEKVTNLQLQKKWIEAKSKMTNPMRSELKFDETEHRGIEDIIQKGFASSTINPELTEDIEKNGIYFATESSINVQNTCNAHTKMLLLCEVLIGHSLTVQKNDPEMILKTFNPQKYDSVFIPQTTLSRQKSQNPAFIIFNPAQVLPRYLVHYEIHSIDNVLELPIGLSDSCEKHLLLPKREFDPTDPLEMHFRLAESQFLRLTKQCGSQDKIKSVEYFTNPPLAKRFAQKRLEFEQRYSGKAKFAKTVLAFHGTEEQNIESIMKDNFSMEQCTRGVHGRGVYLSEFPDISEDYAGNTRKLILCNLLPGKGYNKGTDQSSLEPGYDSHKVREDEKGRAWAHVIYNPDQILPMYVISY